MRAANKALAPDAEKIAVFRKGMVVSQDYSGAGYKAPHTTEAFFFLPYMRQ
jgi:hypothetical protein